MVLGEATGNLAVLQPREGLGRRVIRAGWGESNLSKILLALLLSTPRICPLLPLHYFHSGLSHHHLCNGLLASPSLFLPWPACLFSQAARALSFKKLTRTLIT